MAARYECRTNDKGRKYYVDHQLKRTVWEDPRPLPAGWICQKDAGGRSYYVDHNNKTTSWVDPRPAFPTNSINPSIMAIPSIKATPVRATPGRLPSANPHASPSSFASPVPPAGAAMASSASTYVPSTYVRTNVTPAMPAKPAMPKLEKVETLDEKEEMHREWYKDVLRLSLLDRNMSDVEYKLLEGVRDKLGLSMKTHAKILREMGWDVEEFDDIRKNKQEVIVNECVVCLDQPSSYLVMGCFHLCLCQDCSHEFKPGGPCPMCNAPIKEIRQTYS